MSFNYTAKYRCTRTLSRGGAPQFLLVAGVVGDTSRRRCELAAREDLQMALVIPPTLWKQTVPLVDTEGPGFLRKHVHIPELVVCCPIPRQMRGGCVL